MILVIGITGYYVVREKSVDMSCLMSWGMICLINGVFDCVFLIDRAVKMPKPLFSPDENVLYNVVHFMYIAGPTGELLVSFMSYRVYKDATYAEQNEVILTGPQQPLMSGGSGSGIGTVINSGNGSGNGSQYGTTQQPFMPFAGKGNTLGNTDQ